MNGVAVYKLRTGGLVNVCFRQESKYYQDRLQMCREYEELGKLVSCVITNNEEIFYKARLKAMLMELRNTVILNAEWLADVKAHCPQEVVEQTIRLIGENEERLMKRVAIRCSSLIMRDIPIEDELAIECYNYFN